MKSIDQKKIIIFHPALAPYRVDFFNKLFHDFEAEFYFSLDNLKDQKFDQQELRKEIDFKFNLLTKGFEFGNRSVRFGVFKIIEKTNPEIVFCSEYCQVTLSTLLYKLLFNRKLKILIISDDSIPLSISRKGIRKWLRSIISYHIDGIIFPSENIGEWYKINVNFNTKTLVLPIIHSNEIFRNKLSQVLKQSDQNIQKFGLINKKVFLFVGRLVKIKNIDFLLRAFSNTKRKNEILVIVGDGVESDNLKHLAKELNLSNNCLFIGRLEGDELISWYNIAQCFILPSYQEPYGAVVNEALLAGCKVLCSELAGASELVNRENGYIFNPKDESQLTQLMTGISSNLKPIKLPTQLKNDLMPFTLNEKLETLFTQINT